MVHYKTLWGEIPELPRFPILVDTDVPDSEDKVTRSRSRCLRAGKEGPGFQNAGLQGMKVTLTNNKKGLLTQNHEARC